jgi:hypothetical protein
MKGMKRAMIDGDAAVALVEGVRLVEGAPVEQARLLPAPYPRAHAAADVVVRLVAQDGRGQQQRHGQRQAHQAQAAQGADDEEQRVARQEGHHHHARLHEDDHEQQRVHPGAVGLDEGRKVAVDMQDEVDQEGEVFHRGRLSLRLPTMA